MSDICSSISITSKQPFASLKRVNAKEALEHVVTGTDKNKNTQVRIVTKSSRLSHVNKI